MALTALVLALQITSGSVTLGNDAPLYDVRGGTFSASGYGDDAGNVPVQSCSGFGCRAGSTMDLDAYFGGSSLASNVTYQGVPWTMDGVSRSGEWSFDTTPFVIGSSVVDLPFLFIGYTVLPDSTRIDLDGHGIAEAVFSAHDYGLPSSYWSLDSLRYQFTTPEPQTWLLVLSALAIFVGRGLVMDGGPR